MAWHKKNKEESLFPISALSPLHFFSLSTPLHYAEEIPREGKERKKFQIGTTALLSDEEPFATLHASWSEMGLFFDFEVSSSPDKVEFPKYRDGDSVELFLDTRDLKNVGYVTRFCHHFVFLPHPVGDISHREVTRFRAEESRPFSDPSEIDVERSATSSDYRLRIAISRAALHGYDPASFARLGFTYQINRAGGQPLSFSPSPEFGEVERLSGLWATFHLKGTS